MVGAIVFGIIYQREAWCRYICPLGALGSVYSLPAALHVRARPHICATLCTTHECYKGTPDTPGCSVFHHPLYISDGHNCKLCFKCLRICPHDSVRFYLRPFLQSVWLFGGFARALTPFALSVFFLSMVLLVSSKTGRLQGPLDLTVLAVAAVFLGIALNALLPYLLSDKKEPDHTVSSCAAFGLLILAWGPFMAYQLANIPGLISVRLTAGTGSLLAKFFPGGEVSLLLVFQLAVILLAVLLAAVAFWRTRVYAEKEDIRFSKKGWNVLLIFSALYVVFAVGVTIRNAS
jgi:hypothetical protein